MAVAEATASVVGLVAKAALVAVVEATASVVGLVAKAALVVIVAYLAMGLEAEVSLEKEVEAEVLVVQRWSWG